MSFIRNAASVLAVSVVGTPAAFLTSVVLARFLTVEDRGLYGLVMALASLLCLGFQVGLPSAAIYRIRRLGVDPGRVTATGLVLNLVILGLIVTLGLAGRRPLSERFLAGAESPILYACLAIAGVQLFGIFLRAVARGIDRFDLNNAYDLMENVGTLAAVSIALIPLGGTLSYALAATLGVQVMALLSVGGAITVRAGVRGGVNRDDFGGSLRFGLKNYAQNVSRQIHERIGVLLIGFFIDDPGQAAIFVVALGFVRILNIIPTSIATALFPRLAGSEQIEGGHFTALVTRHSVLWAVAIMLAFLILGPFLIPMIYGSSYRASVLPFILLLPGVASVTLSQVLGLYFIAYDVQRFVIVARVFSALVNLGLNVLLIPSHGILGAAAAGLVSYSLEAALVVGAFVTVSGQGVRDTLVIRRSDLNDYSFRLRQLRNRLSGGR